MFHFPKFSPNSAKKDKQTNKKTNKQTKQNNQTKNTKILKGKNQIKNVKQRRHIRQCYLFHDQHEASGALCQKAPARVPWTHPSSSRGRACKKICFLCTTSWQKEAGMSMHQLLHHIQPMVVRISWSWYIRRWDSHTCRRSICMEYGQFSCLAWP